MVRLVIATIILCLAFAPTRAAASDRPTGKNCNLPAPPASAGEEINHGIILRIYPRAKDIDANYTGCQVVMAPHAGKWVVIALTEIIKGDPVRIWSEHEKDPAQLACRFKNGKVVQGNPATCPTSESLLMKSLAPGCVAIAQEAVAKHGLGAPRPAECEYR